MTSNPAVEAILRLSPVMPVVTIDDSSVAADLARALVAGGIRVIEVTMRTPAALRAIERHRARGAGDQRRGGHRPESPWT